MKPTRIALITGANKGIGFEIARQLGERGYRVTLAGRDGAALSDACAALQQENIAAESLMMDVSDPESIARACASLRERGEAVQVLVNNAGVMLDHGTSVLEAKTEMLFTTFATNAFGPLWLVQGLLPLLPDGARIINVSSEGGQLVKGASTWAPVYCMSKTTLNALTLQLAEALRSRNIAVNAMCPGWTQTRMGGHGAPRTVAQGAATAVWLATEAPQHFTGKFFRDQMELEW